MSPTPDPSTWTLPRLRIDREGVWFHDDAEVTHAGIVANLRENLQVDERGHYLQIGPARVPVEVEDAPFVVERVEAQGEQLVATLNDLSREPVALDTLRVDQRGIPRCRVKDGRFDARLGRAATYQLLLHVVTDPGAEPALVLGGRRYPVPGL
ncbi:MAG TPA: hypothetical protein VK878_07630 [Candidatus Deferrimicrobiaceae bacterium]|nr:hypothetical protein [Candidatus Deferrimicrobiaceae bacterium]